MRLGRRDRDAGSAFRCILDFAFRVQLGFDFSVRHSNKPSRKFGEAVEIAQIILPRTDGHIRHGASSLEARIASWYVQVNLLSLTAVL